MNDGLAEEPVTQTPYAYAFGVILTLMSAELTALDKSFMTEIEAMGSLEPRLVPALQKKYMFAMESVIRVYNTVTVGLDMAIPDEEKLILKRQFQEVQELMSQFQNKNNS